MDYDKKLHLAAGFIIAAMVVFVTHSIPWAVGAALAAGVAKEGYDFAMNYMLAHRDPPEPPAHDVDPADVVFTVMGGAIAALAWYGIQSYFVL